MASPVQAKPETLPAPASVLLGQGADTWVEMGCVALRGCLHFLSAMCLVISIHSLGAGSARGVGEQGQVQLSPMAGENS